MGGFGGTCRKMIDTDKNFQCSGYRAVTLEVFIYRFFILQAYQIQSINSATEQSS